MVFKLGWEVSDSPRVVDDAERSGICRASLVSLAPCVQVERRQLDFGVPHSAPSFVRAESPTHNLLHALHRRARRREEREGNIRSGATGCFWRPLPPLSLWHTRTHQHAHTHSPLFCRAAFHLKFNLRFHHASPSPKESHTRTRFCLHAQWPTAHFYFILTKKKCHISSSRRASLSWHKSCKSNGRASYVSEWVCAHACVQWYRHICICISCFSDQVWTLFLWFDCEKEPKCQ